MPPDTPKKPDARETHPLFILRKKLLNWSHEKLAKKANLTRLDINALEKGKNKGTAARVQEGLAAAFGLTTENIRDLLAGRLAPADAAAMGTAEPEAAPEGAPADLGKAGGTAAAIDPNPYRRRAALILRGLKMPEKYIDAMYNDPDLNVGHGHRDHLFWMSVATQARDADPEHQEAVKVDKQRTIREGRTARAAEKAAKSAPATQTHEPTKRRRAG